MVPLPFTPVPINLGLLAVWICGGMLGAVGVPVFAGFGAGLGALAGPTGGYIIGYIPSVILFGLLVNRAENTERSRKTIAGFLLVAVRGLPAIAACYALGTVWFMVTTGRGLTESLVMCVIPFIPGDVLKVVAAVAVCEALRKPLKTYIKT